MLKFKKENEKQHTTVNNCIMRLEKTLKTSDGNDTIFFQSVDGEAVNSGSKVLSFDRYGRKENPLYRQLFSKKDSLLPGVSVWNHVIKDEAQPDEDNRDSTQSTVSISLNKEMNESFEFDVVKKRKAMEDPANINDVTSSAEALAAFEEFERSVLPAIENIQADEEIVRRMEMVQMEDDMLQGKCSATGGGVYFAWSDCLRCMKIGATRRDSPEVRLRELSSHVTSPFTLAAWLRTQTPFRMEAAAHAHFKDKRINSRGSGAGTEFFHISTTEAVEWVATV